MKGVIIAAGDGGRLQPLTFTSPKVLLPMWDSPLISYPLQSMSAAGIREVVIVVGYRSRQVIEGVRKLLPPWMRAEFAHNPHFNGGNAISLAAAEAYVGDSPFILSMGDHIIEPGVAPALAESPFDGPVLAVDSQPTLDSQVNDATRVLRDGQGRIRRIGKHLKQWNAVDIGVFRFPPSVFQTIRGLQRTRGVALELNEVMQSMADDLLVGTHDVAGLFWSDIDTLEDYRSVAAQ